MDHLFSSLVIIIIIIIMTISGLSYSPVIMHGEAKHGRSIKIIIMIIMKTL